MSEPAPERNSSRLTIAEVLQRAITFHQAGQLPEAERLYRAVLQGQPQHPYANHNIGVLAASVGKLDVALSFFRVALKANPRVAQYWLSYIDALIASGDLPTARESIKAAEMHGVPTVQFEPAKNRIAAASTPHRSERPSPAEDKELLALFNHGRFAEAEAMARDLTQRYPTHGLGWRVLGAALNRCGRNADALEPTRKAAALLPELAEVHRNLGIVLHRLGRLTGAAASYQRALEIEPRHAETHNNLGRTLAGLGRIVEAEASFRRAIAIQPDHAGAQSNLLFSLNYRPEIAAANIHVEHQRWGERYATPGTKNWTGSGKHERGRRLRIGYVSPDLKQHPVAYFFEPLLHAHDRTAVEVFCYGDVQRPDAVTARLQSRADYWRNTFGLTAEAVARQVVDDQIDILVDLAGHTADNRLVVFAQKPAPIQVTWLGYPNTTGLPAMDYRLVDEITDPRGVADSLATERLVRLEKGFLCYLPPQGAPDPGPRPNVANGPITFGSFNNAAKYSSHTLAAWAALLGRVPSGRLFLKGKLFGDADASAAFLARLREQGIEPQRVTLKGQDSEMADHLRQYDQIDIALDPFPYNGTTTTCEALWMGVPVVTLCGNRHAGRVGASLLSQIGLTELVADSVEHYIDIAASLASDPRRLATFRCTLRNRMKDSPLCDAQQFAHQIEAAYRQMWRNFCATADGPASSHADAR